MSARRKLVPRKKFDKNGVLTTRNHAADSEEFVRGKAARKAELEASLKAFKDGKAKTVDASKTREEQRIEDELKREDMSWEIGEIDAFLRLAETGAVAEAVELQQQLDEMNEQIENVSAKKNQAASDRDKAWNPVSRSRAKTRHVELTSEWSELITRRNRAAHELSKLNAYGKQ